MQHTQRRPGTIGMPPRQQSRPPKPKAWNHQDDLLAMRGRKVIVRFRDDTTVQTELLEADAFTLKIRALDGQSALIVWKHDLGSIGLAKVQA